MMKYRAQIFHYANETVQQKCAENNVLYFLEENKKNAI